MSVLYQKEILGGVVGPLNLIFDTNGDGTGDTNAVGDYSDVGVGQTDFKVTTPPGKVNYISFFTAEISDAGSLDAGSYGNNITLVNGIDFAIKNSIGDVVHDFMDGYKIRNNTGWAHICDRVNTTDFGTGDNFLYGRYWIFDTSGFYIRLPVGFSLAVTLHDDFSDLITHHFVASGLVADA